jgi:hypothetical protein
MSKALRTMRARTERMRTIEILGMSVRTMMAVRTMRTMSSSTATAATSASFPSICGEIFAFRNVRIFVDFGLNSLSSLLYEG